MNGHRARTLRALVLVLGAAVLVWTFRGVDLERSGALAAGVPLAALLLLPLPQLLSLSLESAGWSEVFARLGRRVPYLALLRLRIATEALAQTLPAGVVFGESLKPALLDRWCRVPLAEALAGMAARKYLLMLSQGVYVLIMGLGGFAVLSAASTAVIGVHGLPWLVLAASAVLLGAAFGLRSVVSGGAVASQLLALLLRVPCAAWRARIRAGDRRCREIDDRLRRYFAGSSQATNGPLLWFLGGWLFESLETFLILRSLGVELDFTTVAAFEVALSFARNVAFALPSGLGLNDLGYVTFLGALGVADPLTTGAAFMILKRGKELFWALIGYALLAAGRGRPRALEPVTPWA